jgi:hypothetical protein
MLQGVRDGGRRVAAAMAILAGLSPGLSLAQARQWHTLPVAGGTNAIAAAAGLETGLPAWRVLYEAARRRHGLWGEGAGGGSGDAAGEPGGAPAVPLPLSPLTWRGLLGRDGLPDDQLAVAILADRQSALLYRGLAALDEPTLAALAADPDAVQRLHDRHADVLAAFGARFLVREGVVVVPGGEEEAPLWARLVGESPRAPVAFLVALLGANGGRKALLYDSVARLDPPHQRFALGLYRPEGPARAGALLSLAAAFDREIAWWHPEGGAFKRPEADIARLLREARVRSDGSLAPPAARVFWEAVFEEGKPVPREDWATRVRAGAPAEASWLAEQVGVGAPSLRRRRLEQLLFAQRVFGEAGEETLPDVLAVLRGLPEAGSVLLALERIGSRDPALFAAAVGAARRAGAVSGREESLRVHGGLQGALGVVDRARFARTLDRAAAERLVRSLCEVPGEGEGRARALAAWVEGVLLPELRRTVYGEQPPGEPETTILRAMAGDRVNGREEPSPVEWEGLWYRADPGRAEFARLERVRARQGGAGLSEALGVCRSAEPQKRDPCATALGEALVSLVYAASLGDPEGPALAGADPARRHDFGAEPWALPEEVMSPGVPWHVRGSLLGLERALARLSLHGLAGDALPEGPPVLDAVQRRDLAVPAALVNPRELTEAGRDAVAAAIESGRSRVAALRAGEARVAEVCREAGLDPWRARAFEWLLEHEPDSRGSFFSLGELLSLGTTDERPFDGWGVTDALATGLVPRMPGPVPPDENAGRPPHPGLTESFVDLQLRVAIHLAERRLPASLHPWVVATVLPDLFAEARPVAPDDRLGLDAWVRTLSRDRLDDSVASLVGRGPLQPAPLPSPAR